MDICIGKMKHGLYVYIVSTVSPVALLGLHEIVGWCFVLLVFFLLFFFKYFPSVQSAGIISPSPPPLFSLAAKEPLILISFTVERL